MLIYMIDYFIKDTILLTIWYKNLHKYTKRDNRYTTILLNYIFCVNV